MRSRRAVQVALATALLGVSLGLAAGASAASVTGTLALDPATVQVANGATFTVKVVSNSTVPISGLAASITFDKSILQVDSVTRAPAWASAPLFIAGDAAAIATANKKGVLQAVAASFFPPTNVPAGQQDYITVEFKAIGCGSVTMTMPTGRVDSGMLDGRAATYGAGIKTTTTGATVTACQGVAGASAGASAAASTAPGASDSSEPASSDAGASAAASDQPNPSDAGLVAASAGPAPSSAAGGTTDGGTSVTTAEQNGWLTFAVAALAIAAAGLATLILVLAVIAIVAAVAGAVFVFRMWRRTTEADRAAAASAAAATTASAGGASAGETGDASSAEVAGDDASTQTGGAADVPGDAGLPAGSMAVTAEPLTVTGPASSAPMPAQP